MSGKTRSSLDFIQSQFSDIPIRPFQPSDQAAAKDLILSGLGEHFGFIDYTKNPDLDDIQLSYVDAGHVFLVAYAQDHLIGTGALKEESSVRGQLVRISVHPEARRFGLGSQIVDALLQIAQHRTYQEVTLETRETWDDVIHFYERLGFQSLDVQEGLLTMVRQLQDS